MVLHVNTCQKDHNENTDLIRFPINKVFKVICANCKCFVITKFIIKMYINCLGVCTLNIAAAWVVSDSFSEVKHCT